MADKIKESISDGIEKAHGKGAALRWRIIRNTAIVCTVVLAGVSGVSLTNHIAIENSEPTEGIVIHKYHKEKFFTGKMYTPERWVVIYENEEGERGDAEVNSDLWHNLDEGDWYVG